MCRIGLAGFMSLLNSMYLLWHRTCCAESADIYGAMMPHRFGLRGAYLWVMLFVS